MYSENAKMILRNDPQRSSAAQLEKKVNCIHFRSDRFLKITFERFLPYQSLIEAVIFQQIVNLVVKNYNLPVAM